MAHFESESEQNVVNHTQDVKAGYKNAQLPQNKKESLRNCDDSAVSKSRGIIIKDVSGDHDQYVQAVPNNKISQPGAMQLFAKNTNFGHSQRRNKQRLSVPNKIALNYIATEQPGTSNNEVKRTSRGLSLGMRSQRDEVKKESIIIANKNSQSNSLDKLKLRLSYEKPPNASEMLLSARRALSSRNLPRDLSPYYKRLINSNRRQVSTENNRTVDCSNDFKKPISNNIFNEVNPRKKKGLEFSELLRTKIHQQRTIRQLIQGLEPTQQRNSSQQSLRKSAVLKDMNTTKKENGIVVPKKPAALVLDPAALTFEALTKNLLDDQNEDILRPAQEFKEINSQAKLPNLNSVDSECEHKLAYQLNRKQQKKHQIPDKGSNFSPEKALAIAKDRLYNKRNTNYTKLLRETFQIQHKTDKADQASTSRTKEDDWEDIRRYFLKKETNRGSQEKFERLIKMDIAHKMLPLKDTVEKYKEFKRKLIENKDPRVKKPYLYRRDNPLDEKEDRIANLLKL